MSETEAAKAEPGDGLEAVIFAWADPDADLIKYLADSDLANEIVVWLHKETGIKQIYLRLALKLLAPLVGKTAKRGKQWLGGIVARRFKSALKRIPGYENLEEGLRNLLARFDKDIRAKREVQEILAGRRPPHDTEFVAALSLDLQTHVSQLQRQDDLGRQMSEGFERIEGLLNRQPALYLWTVERAREHRFFYGAQWAPLVGRDPELTRLQEFLDADGDFKWWLVAAPGGQGKSRLALEFCIRTGLMWRAGFLRSKDFDWDNWQPERPTLMIADYAAGHAEKLHAVAVTLSDRAKEGALDFPVRLLLVERDAEGSWLSGFEGTGGERRVMRDFRFGDPLILHPLDDNALWQVMRRYLDHPERFNPEEALSKLAEIDREERPLFAALLADAMRVGQQTSDWDRTSIVRDVIEREADRFWPADVTDEEKNLLAFVTLTGELPRDRLPIAGTEGLLPTDLTFAPQRYQLMSGRPAETTLAPLEPDIIGELFALDHLNPSQRGGAARTERLRHAAWNEAPPGMSGFLPRAAQDFPDHPTLKPMALPAIETLVQGTFWCLAARDLIFCYCKNGKLAEARSVYDKLAVIAGRYDEACRWEWQAVSAFNLITCYGETGELPEARSIYDQLATLAGSHDIAALRHQQARAAVNLIGHYGEGRELIKARLLYNELAALAENRDEAVLRGEQAIAALNVITAFGEIGKLAEARSIYDELAALAGSRDEAVLWTWQAKGACDLVLYYGENGELDEARSVYEELAALAGSHDVAELREQKAKGASNLIACYGKDGKRADARLVYDELAALARNHEEAVLREAQSSGAVNLIIAYCLGGELAAAQGVWRELCALCAGFSNEVVLAKNLVKGTAALIGTAQKFGREEISSHLWQTIVETHPNLKNSVETVLCELERR